MSSLMLNRNPEWSTLIDILRWRAIHQPDKQAYIFLPDGETEICLTYGMLEQRARAIAMQLQSICSPGERALLLYPSGLDFITAFLGCLYAGAIAVPAYPPRRNQNLTRLQSIVIDAQATIALTTQDLLDNDISIYLGQDRILGQLKWLATDTIATTDATSWQPPTLTEETLAFLQYTSGSTGMPKGVKVSHLNLLSNEQMIQHAFGHSSETIFVGWLPLFHDMGLIGNVLQPLYLGIPCIFMAPVTFLQTPFYWLQAISRYRATTSGGPNFAYDLCIRSTTPEQRSQLDLSSWQLAFNGSETVRAETLEAFTSTFESCGFKREAFYPCYGMAEATLFISGGAKTKSPQVLGVDDQALGQNQVAILEPDQPSYKAIVGVGHPWLDQSLRIVSPDTRQICAEDRVGEIWVAGTNIAGGYWNQSEQTAQTFNAYTADTNEGPFLQTGDLGFVHQGELFITGRLKDLIVIRGRNYYPQDIELTVEQCHPALRAGCGAAFSVDVAGEERLVIVQEVERHYLRKLPVETVVQAIRQAVAAQHELQVYAITLLKTASIPKTSSGKIQRSNCRKKFLEASLSVVGNSILNEPPAPTSADKPLLSGEILRSLPEIERRLKLELYLQQAILAVLGISPSALNKQQPLINLGLDSLAAVTLQHRLETELDLSLSMTAFLQDTSFEELILQLLEQLDRQPISRNQVFAIKSEEQHCTQELPLSPNQQGLWFLNQLAPDSGAYNIAFAVRIRSKLNVVALKQAFENLVTRHPSLRTSYILRDNQPWQQIHQHSSLSFKQIDATNWSENQLHNELITEAYRPFDLAQESLLRVLLFTSETNAPILLLSVHHIAADLWSLLVLVDELGLLYSSANTGTMAKLPPVAFSYTNYINWQRVHQLPALEQTSQSYWKEQLADLPLLNLPTLRSRPAVQTYQGAAHGFDLDLELTNQLKQLAQRCGVTLYTLLLTAFEILLHRYTGQDDLVVGSVTSGRQSHLKQTVGYCANPIVLRVDLSGNPTVQELLYRVRQTVLAALEQADYPFQRLVEILQPERDLSRSPLFQVMFVFQKPHILPESSPFVLRQPGAVLELDELVLESVGIEQRTAQFDLTLIVTETQQQLLASFEYNTDLFDHGTIERMSQHFQTLLGAIALETEQRVSELPLLTDQEQGEILKVWNRTQTSDTYETCLHHLIEAQVQRSADTVAVVFGERQLTYKALNEQANQLAHHLRSLGVKPGVLVGICVERSLEMVVGLFGILKAGGAYLPLDPSYPPERLTFMLSDAGVSVLLTQQRLLPQLPEQTVPRICLDSENSLLQTQSLDNPHFEVQPHDLAYVIYTSGSTGRPKGVMNTHRGICNRLLWMQDTYQLTSGDRVLQKTPFSFDVSVWEFFWPLLAGACLVVAQPGGHQDNPYLIRTIAEHQITTLHFVPSMLQLFLEEPNLEQTGSLRQVFCSGEALPNALQKRFFDNLDAALHNLYGPTEAAVDVTFWQCDRTQEQLAVPIGKPIANMQTYLLDRYGQPVPIGVPGELHLAGIGLARGYLNRPELTAEKFVPNPFSQEPGARLYRTGDLARYRPDGNLEYLGRSDFQVKIRGFRIELGEVEASLRQHPQVREAIAIAPDFGTNGQRLVAYVVPQLGTHLLNNELRCFLRERLPDYMVPSIFVILETIPLSPNGKVDRRSLPVPAADRVLQVGYVPPRTPTEELLVGIYTQVLGLKTIGIYDNFFDLGGHSLLATQVVSRIRTLFAIELPVHQIFEYPTIATLSPIVEAVCHQGNHWVSAPIQPMPPGGQLPLSFSQQRLWFLNHLEGHRPIYNMPAALRMIGPLQIPILERCFQEIVERQASLRTTFPLVDGIPVQKIAERLVCSLPVIDLQSLSGDEQAIAVQHHISEVACGSFSLDREPLLRLKLLCLARQSYILVVVMHHIIADGWSIGVMIRELSTLYQTFLVEANSPLAPLPIQYVDFAAWQQQLLENEQLAAQVDYWKQQLADATNILDLPTDYPRPPVQTFRGGQESFELSPALTAQLHDLARQSGATVFMVLFTAFVSLLYRYSGQEDILVGSPVANRNRQELEDIIGFFVNTLVLRTHLFDQLSFQELLTQVKQTCLEAYAHQDIPFEKLVEILKPERSLSHNPLFQVMFVFQNAPREQLNLSDVTLDWLEVDTATTKFDLTLIMEERGSQLVGTIEYSQDLYNRTTIQRLIGHLQTLLSEMVIAPQQMVATAKILSPTEEQQILQEWNFTPSTFNLVQCIHQLFEEQVTKTPDRVALELGDEHLTYRELNSRANQLAHYLRQLQVQPDEPVGLCVSRSLSGFVGLLGILKAGGAYVPLDPTYPPERLAFSIQDAKVKVLVTETDVASALPSSTFEIVYLDRDRSDIAQQSVDNPECPATGENLAYIIYTSGSTGIPKGVAMQHQSLINLISWQIENVTAPSSARTAQFASLSFDVSVQETFATWCEGGTLVLVPEQTRRDPTLLLRFLSDAGIKRFFAPYVVLQQLAEVAIERDQVPKGLQDLITAGEQLCITPEIARFFERLEHCTLWNHYGPTETHLATAYNLTGNPSKWVTFPPIGRPIANTQVYLLDRNQQLVPVGIPGEIYIAGTGLARGYYNRPELTADKFSAHAFSQATGRRWYRTGDIARYRADGVLEYLGRIDNQVKIRGFRIELAEIEAVLGQHPDVLEAVAIATMEPTENKRLIAYIVPKPNQVLTTQELRTYLKTKLPEYMVPSAFVMLETLPLTPSGKVDRRVLPTPDRSSFENNYIAPETSTEVVLADIWSEVLHLPQVSIHDNFFDLGGHSLLATQLLSRINQIFSSEISLQQLFMNPTIAELETVLAKLLGSQNQVDEIAQTFLEVNNLTPEEIEVLFKQIGHE
ncbi:non-ribosomal peptide synthetase [Anabaena sp. PCC 7108]|uniref:non-ribosomal peptide synthetase n=1 Tax=Anabaena sp. PCC 7108 TaxID=163908 RepID=UPI001181A16B|nr:non-ribosomal peptide synthetase [Anabaena sp. PCC 7108]